MLDPNETRLDIAASRFHEKTRMQPDGCIYWTAYIRKDGYGQLHFLGEITTAHRVAWTLAYGAPPKGKHVLHRCDVRQCVNPDHLFLGSNEDNNLDKMEKGRQARGETHHKAVLTEDQVRAIAADPRGSRELGHEHGVTREAISAIRKGRSWQHLDLPKGPARHSTEAALTEAQVAAIRQDDRAMWVIAEEYGVARETIRRAKMGRTYRAASGPLATGRIALTNPQVRAIRLDTRTQAVVAAEYGISQSLVSLIRLGRAYPDVLNIDGSDYVPVRGKAKVRTDMGLARMPKTA